MKWLWNQPVRESEPTSPTISLLFFLFAWMKYHWETDHQPSIMYQQCSHMAVPYRLWRWRFQHNFHYPKSTFYYFGHFGLPIILSVTYWYWIVLWNKTLKYGFYWFLPLNKEFYHFWSPKVLDGEHWTFSPNPWSPRPWILIRSHGCDLGSLDGKIETGKLDQFNGKNM